MKKYTLVVATLLLFLFTEQTSAQDMQDAEIETAENVAATVCIKNRTTVDLNYSAVEFTWVNHNFSSNRYEPFQDLWGKLEPSQSVEFTVHTTRDNSSNICPGFSNCHDKDSFFNIFFNGNKLPSYRLVWKGNSHCYDFVFDGTGDIVMKDGTRNAPEPSLPKIEQWCTCEDWNNDGKFGIVLHKSGSQPTAIKTNIGPISQCKAQMSSFSQCTGR